MRHTITYALLAASTVVMAVAAPQLVVAQTVAPAVGVGQLQTITGTISSVDAKQQLLVVKSGQEEERFKLDAGAKITSGDRALKINDLRPGAEVTVSFKEAGGQQLAQSVSLKEESSAGAQSQQQPKPSKPAQP